MASLILRTVFLFVVGWLILKLFTFIRQRLHTTQLTGPPNPSFLFGTGHLLKNCDSSAVYEEWAEQYGGAYTIPAAFGSKHIVLCDPKAVAHVTSKETEGYVHLAVYRLAMEQFTGKSVLWVEGDAHKKQRKMLSPAFGNQSVKKFVPVFLDGVYKVKEAWDAMLNSSTEDHIVVDVEGWINRMALDNLGNAGFSHDFGLLGGKQSVIADLFDSFGTSKASFAAVSIIILGHVFPFVVGLLPTRSWGIMGKLNDSMSAISSELLKRSRMEREGLGGGIKDTSVIGLLVRWENDKSDEGMTHDEILAQMKVLIIAGYETIAVSLTWVLIELAANPEIQRKLREELTQFSGTNPTLEELSNGLPYLDAVVHESIRLHPALAQTIREAARDDVIPLSQPITTRSGETIDRIAVAKGTAVINPIRYMNRATAIWGPDAKKYIPERWLDPATGESTMANIPARAKEVSGHRHLLSFTDGPRTCLGKGFALAVMKCTLFVLIRSFTFEMRDGPQTQIGTGESVLPRPKVVGEEGNRFPMRVRRVDQ